MRQVVRAVLATFLFSSVAFAGKPPASPINPQVAYVSGSGNSVKLMISDESGSNSHVLYSSATSFRFDLGPRGLRKISINGQDGLLRILTFTSSSNGTLSAVGPPVALTAATSGTTHDFSADGSKIAYACCDGPGPQQLKIVDIGSGEASTLDTVLFVWDVAFFRNGQSIAYIVPATNNVYDLYEISSAGGTPRKIFSSVGEFNIDASRTNPDALVMSYRPNSSSLLIGLWKAPEIGGSDGTFLIPNLANRTPGFFPNLNCNDTRLAYMSSTTPAGGQVFFIRNLTTAQDALFAKNSNMQLQFWPTCQ
jgi:hypothetical protein